MRFLLQLSSLLLVQCALAANILFLFYHDSGSHQGSASKYFIRLAEAGHHVTIFDTTSKTPRIHHPNVTAIDAYMPSAEDPKAKSDFLWSNTLRGWQIAFGYWRGDADLGRIRGERSAELTEALNRHWDLVMVDEIFTSHGYAAAIWRRRVAKGSKYMVVGTSWRMLQTDSTCSLTNILFLFHHDGGSRTAAFFVSLATAGHRVTLFGTTARIGKFYYPNVSSMAAFMPSYDASEDVADALWNETLRGWKFAFGFAGVDTQMGRLMVTR